MMKDIGTVGKLISFLQTQPSDRHIFLSSNVNGDRISALFDIEEAMIASEDVDAADVDIYATPEEIAAPDSQYDPVEDAAPEGALRVLIFGPVGEDLP